MILPALLLLLTGCNTDPTKIEESPTTGKIKIGVDDSYRLILDTEIYTFQKLYIHARLNPVYKPEADVFADLINDSVKTIVAGRQLTKGEDEFLKSKKFIPRTTKIAYDAVALIINNSNPDSLITYRQVKDIFTGKTSAWKQIQASSQLGDIKIVFDNNKSGNTRYIKEKFGIKENFPEYCYAVNTCEEVVNFVEKNNNSIGIIGVNWISDKDDTLTHRFLNKVKVVAVSAISDPDGLEGYYTPCQGFIAKKTYPLVREVFIISKETFAGLGSGFASFIAGDVGQRIILKSGLLPATMPVRLIKVKNKF